jgi:hypothetical protein
MENNSGISAIINDLYSRFQEVQGKMAGLMKENKPVSNREEFEAHAKAMNELTDRLAGLSNGIKLQESIASEQMKEKSKQLVKSSPKKMKNQGLREVEVMVGRGVSVKVKTYYYSEKIAVEKSAANVAKAKVFIQHLYCWESMKDSHH